MLEMTELTEKISKWHLDRQITVNGNSSAQVIKLGEEFGELCSAIVRGNKVLVEDSIGDMFVVLVAIAELEGTNITDCVESAYNEIKDRKGKLLPNGSFLKEEDMISETAIKDITPSSFPDFNSVLIVKLYNDSKILVMLELNEARKLPDNLNEEFNGKEFDVLKIYLETLGKVTTL